MITTQSVATTVKCSNCTTPVKVQPNHENRCKSWLCPECFSILAGMKARGENLKTETLKFASLIENKFKNDLN